MEKSSNFLWVFFVCVSLGKYAALESFLFPSERDQRNIDEKLTSKCFLLKSLVWVSQKKWMININGGEAFHRRPDRDDFKIQEVSPNSVSIMPSRNHSIPILLTPFQKKCITRKQ